MNEHTRGGGGPANTPPFPRRSAAPGDSTPQQDAGYGEQAGPPTSSQSADSDSDPSAPGVDSPGRPTRPNRAFAELADRLEEVAERIDQLLDTRLQGAPGTGAAATASAAAEAIQELADYLRESDLRSVANDLAGRVREKPLQSVLTSFAAGWVLGKIVR